MANTCLDRWKIYSVLNLGNQAVIFLYGETSLCYCDFYKAKLLTGDLFSENEWSEGQCPCSSESYRKTFFTRETQVNQFCLTFLTVLVVFIVE